MAAGALVPDEIPVAMVRDRLAEPDAKAGFLLDGFPRTIAQGEQLRGSLEQLGQRLDRVLELVVEEEELVHRLSGRRMLVDGEWVQRDDDRPETVRRRLEVYREQTAPLPGAHARAGARRGGVGAAGRRRARARPAPAGGLPGTDGAAVGVLRRRGAAVAH